jgi:hypothetical protein
MLVLAAGAARRKEMVEQINTPLVPEGSRGPPTLTIGGETQHFLARVSARVFSWSEHAVRIH